MSTVKINSTEKKLSDRLKEVRKTLNLTQAEFAVPIGITGAYVSDIEKGKAIPSEPVLRAILSNYQISRKWILEGEGEMFEVRIIAEGHEEYRQTLPEPVKKTIEVMLEHPEKAWEFYALILERAEAAMRKEKKGKQ